MLLQDMSTNKHRCVQTQDGKIFELTRRSCHLSSNGLCFVYIANLFYALRSQSHVLQDMSTNNSRLCRLRAEGVLNNLVGLAVAP